MTPPLSSSEAPGALEYPACPVCGRNDAVTKYPLASPYAVVRCRGCGLHYLFPRQTETAMQNVYRELSYFEGGAHGYADTSYAGQEKALRATFRRLLRNLSNRALSGGRLLEIGCGYGYLLEEAKSFFDERAGTEFSPQAAERAATTGAKIFVGGAEQLPGDAVFDCIIATQVIEHVYDPVAFLIRLRKHTKSGGHVIVATPDIGGALRRLTGRFWPSFKVPEHVVYFDFDTLKSTMHQAGFETVRRLPYPHAFPLALIAGKLGLRLPKGIGRLSIWVPATSVAAYGSTSHA